MTTLLMARFFALLAVAANLLLIAVLVVAWCTRGGRRAPAWAGAARQALARWALPLAWLVAATATLGSLYLSEVAHFIPCKLCWYQRIGMYPLAVTLAIAAYVRDAGYRRYAIPVAVLGAGLSSYHYLLERVPALAGAGACDPAAPCTVLWIWEFGFVSIPYMALSAFVLIAVLLAVGVSRHEKEERRVQSNPRASVA